jgi:hypothetical protein
VSPQRPDPATTFGDIVADVVTFGDNNTVYNRSYPSDPHREAAPRPRPSTGGGGEGHRTCDHCHGMVTGDRNGWWVGQDDTSDCPASPRGHEVDGTAREGA